MPIPETVSYSEFREHLATYLDHVVDDSLPLVVKRKNGKKVVVISEDEYNKMDETAYLMSTEANRKHLLEAMKSTDFVVYESADDFIKKNDL